MMDTKIFRTSFGEVYGASESHLFISGKIIHLSKICYITIEKNRKYVLLKALTKDGKLLSEKICFSDSEMLPNHDKDLEELASFLEKEGGKDVTFWKEVQA